MNSIETDRMETKTHKGVRGSKVKSSAEECRCRDSGEKVARNWNMVQNGIERDTNPQKGLTGSFPVPLPESANVSGVAT